MDMISMLRMNNVQLWFREICKSNIVGLGKCGVDKGEWIVAGTTCYDSSMLGLKNGEHVNEKYVRVVGGALRMWKNTEFLRVHVLVGQRKKTTVMLVMFHKLIFSHSQDFLSAFRSAREEKRRENKCCFK